MSKSIPKRAASLDNRKLKNAALTKKLAKLQIKRSKKSPKPRPESIKTLLKDRWPKIMESGAMANALIASIGEGLIIVDKYGAISHINQPALDIIGYESHEMIDKWLPQALPSFDLAGNPIPSPERPSLKALMTGKPVADIVNYQRKDGSLVPVYATASPFLIKDEPKGVIIIFRDVSKEIQIERAKDEFVSLASHQLRTPLTSIRMFSELLKDTTGGKLNSKQLKYVDKILFSTEKMISLVTDLLSISRLNLGQLEIRPTPTNLNELIEARLQEIEPVAISAAVKLFFNSQVNKAEIVLVDRDLLAQALHNLLSNAVRYSRAKNGRVEVNLTKTKKNYQIAVADNGIGIPAAASSRIYERFFRADNAVKTQADGTGLGLYLVKEIMEASGGKTWFESRPGKGTIFYLCVPIKAPPRHSKFK